MSNATNAADLDTLKACLKNERILFVLHQASVVNSGKSAAIAMGTIAFSVARVIVPGAFVPLSVFLPVFSMETSFNTYYFFVDLSDGTVLWSNYTDNSTAPVDVLMEYATQDHNMSISVDSLNTHVLYRIHNYHLSSFPKHKNNAFEKNMEKSFHIAELPTILIISVSFLQASVGKSYCRSIQWLSIISSN